MIYFLWQTGRFSNREIGELFGLSNPSLSKRAGIVRKRLREKKRFKNEFDRLNALIKLWPLFLSCKAWKKWDPHGVVREKWLRIWMRRTNICTTYSDFSPWFRSKRDETNLSKNLYQPEISLMLHWISLDHNPIYAFNITAFLWKLIIQIYSRWHRFSYYQNLVDNRDILV